MKRTVLLFIAILAYYYSNAQNTPWSTSGNIGIGTTNPMSAFQVLGIATLESLTLGYGTNPAIITTDDNTKPISFQIAGTEFMRLNKNGYVGIGTTNPTTMLSLVGGAINLGTNQGQYILPTIDNSSTTPLATGSNVFGLFSGDLMLRSYWGVSVDLNDGSQGDSGNNAAYTRIPNTSSFTINSRTSPTAFTTLFAVRNNGNVLIGRTSQKNTSYKLDVNGPAHATSIVVNSDGADFVFEPTYHLNSLSWLAKYINQNHHLPEIASAKQMQADGLNLGDNQIKLLQKVEELTLYLIEKDKKQKEDENKLQSQQTEIKSQQEEINLLKQQVQSLIKTVNKYQTN